MSDEPTRGVIPTGGAGAPPVTAAHEDPYYVTAAVPPGGERDRVVKQGDTFAVLDHHGDIRPVGMKEQGLYHEGTRFLSALVLRLGRGRPMFLSSTVSEDNVLLTADLTNPDVRDGDRIAVPRGTVHLFRGILLWEGTCHQRLRLRNYGTDPVDVAFALRFEADYADIFEVRGTTRTNRGLLLPPAVGIDHVVLGYKGLDGVVRRTRLTFGPVPDHLSATDAQFRVALPPHGEATVHVAITCEIAGSPAAAPVAYDVALARSTDRVRARLARTCDVYTDNELFNDWLNRSRADLDMMVTETPEGIYPYAGVP